MPTRSHHHSDVDFGTSVRDRAEVILDAEAVDRMHVNAAKVALMVEHKNWDGAHELVERLRADSKRREPRAPLLATPLTELGVEVRTANALETRDVRDLEDLVTTAPVLLKGINNVDSWTLVTLYHTALGWVTRRCQAAEAELVELKGATQ